MSEQREQYSTALTTMPQGDNMSLMQLGEMLSKSGYFQDAKGAAQAIVKVLAGRELGIGPIAAMTGIHIIQGKVGIGANIMAAKVKGSARYDYRVLELTDDVCRVEFLERVGDKLQRLGVSEFTKADAKAASTKNMSSFPRNMLFARAMSNGVKWFVPDISIAPLYTPDELGATVDYETGEIVDSTATDTTPPRAEQPKARPPNGGQKSEAPSEPEGPDGLATIPSAPPADLPRNGLALLNYVNQRVQVTYSHVNHLQSGIRQELGQPKWSWCVPSDTACWQQALAAAIQHAEAKVQAATQPPLDLQPESEAQ